MKYETVKSLKDVDLKRSTGVSRHGFEQMLQVIQKGLGLFGRPPKLNRADQLLLTLMYWLEYHSEIHIGLTYDSSTCGQSARIQSLEEFQMKAVGYIRVSSEMQIETGHSLDAQRTLITDYVRAKGWSQCEIFCDAGLSGTLSERPALQTLMARAEQHDFDVVVVHAIDRFYRDLSGLRAALHRLGEHQITFVSITENLDFSTPWGKLVLAVLGALAEIYIDKLRDETKKGKLARARKGLWNGSIPFGYCNGLCAACTDVNGKDYCPNFGQPNRSCSGILIPHPIESVAVQLTFRWYDTTRWSHRVIAAKLNAYEFVLPDGTTCHFRSKRYPAKGGPQPITQSTRVRSEKSCAAFSILGMYHFTVRMTAE